MDKPLESGRSPALLLVEGHALVRAGLRSLLVTTPHLNLVAEAANMSSALGLARQHRPDAILVGAAAWASADSGVATTLKREFPLTCVLVIGGDEGGTELAAGHCCLPCEAGIQELCTAVSNLLGGRCADCRFQAGCRVTQSAAALSRRERQVAVRVAEGLTSKQIASMLGLAIRTVNTYRENLARKIGASSAASLTRYVIESGLRDTGVPDGDES